MRILSKIQSHILVTLLTANFAFIPTVAQAAEFNEATARAFDARKYFQGMALYCQQWVQQQPNDWNANDYLGVALFEMKNYRSAIPCFARAIKCNPNNYYPWKQIAMAESNAGNQDATEKALRDGVQYSSANFDAGAWAWFGSAFGACHQWNDAINCWQHANELQPTPNWKECLAVCYFNRGKDEAFANKIDESLADCRKAAAMGNKPAQDSIPQLIKFKTEDVPKLDERRKAVEAEKARWLNAMNSVRPYTSGGGGGMVDFGAMEHRRELYESAHGTRGTY